MELVKVVCPQCGGSVEVDDNFKTARCPFCRTSFIVEETKKPQVKEVLATKVIDVDPADVQNELGIYSLFGWDFKHRHTRKEYDGKRYFKNGNVRDKYKDVTELTLQRDIKAEWCTKELLAKEQQFFEIREEYQKANKDFLYKKYFDSNRNAVYEKKYTVWASLSVFFGAVLFLSLLIASISLMEDGYVFGFVLLILALLELPLGFVLMGIFFKQGKNAQNRKQKEMNQKYKAETDAFNETQNERVRQMEEIATWAGKQMKQKFGYEISPSFNESNS